MSKILLPGPQYCVPYLSRMKLILSATGKEELKVLNFLAEIMSLKGGDYGREMFIKIHKQPGIFSLVNFSEKTPIIFHYRSGDSTYQQIINAIICSIGIASCYLPYGGFLIHGALIEKNGYGIILSGPSGIGKSTACKKLPVSWSVLSDDATLVLKQDDGQYFAHPWPTWSRFFNNGPGGKWDTNHGIPLKSVFFLYQDEIDLIEPLDKPTKLVMILESINHMFKWSENYNQNPDNRIKTYSKILENANQFISAVPVFRLKNSLSGKFWEKIDSFIENQEMNNHIFKYENNCEISKPTSESIKCEFSRIFKEDHIPILFSGQSMYPVLKPNDLLDLVPYGNRKPEIGDVICFFSSEEEKIVVHRIINKKYPGYLTQGDNNRLPDFNIINENQITGLVIGAIRNGNYLKVFSGNIGRLIRIYSIYRNKFLFLIKIILQKLGIVNLFKIFFNPYLLKIFKPRYVLYSARRSFTLRIFIEKKEIGSYNSHRDIWVIKFPYNLIFQKNDLPVINFSLNNLEKP